VMMKGREDHSSVPGDALSRRRVRYEGLQASQSSSVGNMAESTRGMYVEAGGQNGRDSNQGVN